ncbi:MAG: histidine kinase dimerization/phospho-acceptor domain-containing protein, partial [Desulfomonile sp.]
MDEIDLFERERKVLETANALLATAADNKNSWYDHYEKLLSEFERVVSQSKRLIRLGDIMQLKLNTLNEQFRVEVENHKKTQAEKEAFQAQLFQSQKLEAIGTLVGGIAHDFNNMLQIILGYSQLLLDDKKKGEAGYKELKTIIETGKSGANLVENLLAFGQQGQIFPVPLDLNHQ